MTNELKKDQFCREIEAAVREGKYPEGTKLPRFTLLAEEFGVSMKTIRAGMKLLEQRGVVECIQGKGTFLTVPGGKQGRYRVLVVLPFTEKHIEDPYLYILPGVERRAMELGWELVRLPLPLLRALGHEGACKRLRSEHFSGVLYLGGGFVGTEMEIEVFKELELPVVLPHAFSRDRKVLPFGMSCLDESGSFTAALEYLRSMGHRRVGTIFLRTQMRGFATSEAYLKKLKELGLDPARELLQSDCLLDTASADHAVAELLKLNPLPTAIVCFSDFFALEVYRALRKRQIKIPDDISVMGYCGYPGAEFFDPPLTTIDLGYERLGVQCVELLAAQNEWFVPGEKGPCRSIEYDLKIRGSVKRRNK